MYQHDVFLSFRIQLKSLIEPHTCTQSNMSSNKCATQGWIADVIKDKLRSDGDVLVAELRRWLVRTYNVEAPYMKVYRRKEQAYTDLYVAYGVLESENTKSRTWFLELLKKAIGVPVVLLSLWTCRKG
ncbi:uncharacterized protein [Rutidosis leptorrhynchoides]|uniref:uncharacterized protein n=1 Tax=Rutidosis leptorrhynchoides TaxID=125765 RepID=UPI003A9A2287